MYKICGKVKETEKTLFFNCIFCHTEKTLPRVHCHAPGKKQRDPCLQGTTQHHPSALLAVCMGLLWELVFWELLAAGGPGRARLPCCNEQFGGMAPTSHLCKHLPKITEWGLLQGPCLQGGPNGMAVLARCQPVHGHWEQGSCVQSKVLHSFLKHLVLLPSVPLQDLGHPTGPCRACCCERFRSLALLSAIMQPPPKQ